MMQTFTLTDALGLLLPVLVLLALLGGVIYVAVLAALRKHHAEVRAPRDDRARQQQP
jgi:hypothetical protein